MDAATQKSQNSGTKTDLSKVLEEILLVLSQKEKDVVTKRFSLDNKPKWTLEKIGQKFSVTRERIRQIEKIALNKLRRTSQNSKLNAINEIADALIKRNGGVIMEERLVMEILKAIQSNEELDGHISRLALNINVKIAKEEKNNVYHGFWRWKEVNMSDIQEILDTAIKFLTKNNEVIDTELLVTKIQEELSAKEKNFEPAMILSTLETDYRLKKIKEGGFGLMSWRHINPKSIRDKAYIVLKKNNTPLHFSEIAGKIAALGFDSKIVTTQAVHNELIRCDLFVLVGRGLYALKEWGYKKGTVSDIIESLLRKKSPMEKQEIVVGVLKQRQVKKGTISLNLQKNPKFVRVGRAVYSFKGSTENCYNGKRRGI